MLTANIFRSKYLLSHTVSMRKILLKLIYCCRCYGSIMEGEQSRTVICKVRIIIIQFIYIKFKNISISKICRKHILKKVYHLFQNCYKST